MRRRSGLGAVLALAAASLLVAGCDDTSVDGSPTGTSTVKNAGLFEPCGIPADAVRAAGLDPATKNADFFGVQHTGWEACAWDSGSWYYLGIIVTDHTLDEVKSNPRNTDIQPAAFPARDAITYRENKPDKLDDCTVAFKTSEGTVMVIADKKGSRTAEDDVCAVAIRGAASLNASIPN